MACSAARWQEVFAARTRVWRTVHDRRDPASASLQKLCMDALLRESLPVVATLPVQHSFATHVRHACRPRRVACAMHTMRWPHERF